MDDHSRYVSPLASRNASPEMQAVWSPRKKFTTWRKLWLALAEAEHELGLPVTREQVDELKQHLEDVDFDAAAVYEKKLRHDVMAHVHALGDQAPTARPIIHLGATSQFVNCNTELIQLREALQIIARKVATVIDRLATFAVKFRGTPTLAFTHYQPAQPTTVGKRAALWAHDLMLGLEDVEHRLATLRFRGVKGTTGTQASFLSLFGGNTPQAHARVDNRKEMEEPFETNQIGSSAMAYKRNPMRCERICGLSKFVIGMTQTPFVTASEQWFERTLDDSSVRRLTLPEPFLALDGVLDLMINVSSGLVVYEKTVAANLAAELPFMASENLMMAAVQQGGDRQELHEIIRTHSQAAAHQVKAEGKPNDLIERLRSEPAFAKVDLDGALEPSLFIGRAPQQVDAFIADVVEPIRQRYRDDLDYDPSLSV